MDMIRALRPARYDGWILFSSLLFGIFWLYVLAADQGLLLSLLQGATAFDVNLLHELVHDARHAAGFPCH